MEIVKFIQSFASPFWDRFFIQATRIGDDGFFVILFALFFWCISKDFGYRMGFAFYSNSAWNSILKNIFQVPRHFGQIDVRTLNEVAIGGYSFPSGHVQNVTSFSTSFILRYRYKLVYTLAILVILLVSLSRLYLGAHTPMDVLGSLIIGAGWVILAEWVFGTFSKGWLELKLLAVAGALFLGTLIASDTWYFSSIGTVISILLAYYLDEKLLHFEVPKRWGAKLGLLLGGLLVYYIVEGLVTPLLTRTPTGKFTEGFLIGILITLIIPALYMGLKLVISQIFKGGDGSRYESRTP